jgi:hypothetical protein
MSKVNMKDITVEEQVNDIGIVLSYFIYGFNDYETRQSLLNTLDFFESPNWTFVCDETNNNEDDIAHNIIVLDAIFYQDPENKLTFNFRMVPHVNNTELLVH